MHFIFCMQYVFVARNHINIMQKAKHVYSVITNYNNIAICYCKGARVQRSMIIII